MIAYRVSSYDTPCPPSPSRRDGRWGRAGAAVVNYWCEMPYTAWAEIYRYEGMTGADVMDVSQRLWIGRFEHVDFVEIDDPLLGQFGVARDDLTGDDWRACQDLAERLLADGIRDLKVPSAALPGTFNLLLFGQRLPVPIDAAVVDPEVDIPCSVAADHSIGVPDVIDYVRHRGDPYVGDFEHDLPTPLP